MPDTSGWQTCQLYTFTIVTVYTRVLVLESRKNNRDDLETFNCLSFPCSRLTTKKDLTVGSNKTNTFPHFLCYQSRYTSVNWAPWWWKLSVVFLWQTLCSRHHGTKHMPSLENVDLCGEVPENINKPFHGGMPDAWIIQLERQKTVEGPKGISHDQQETLNILTINL